MQNFLSALGEFFLTFFLYVSLGIKFIFTTIANKFTTFINSIDLPLLPSRSRILTYSYVSGTLLALFLIYSLFINIKTYCLFTEDKKLAENEEFRIKESKLFGYCIFGGALGGFIGMQKARHKTQKPLFSVGVRILLVVQVLLFSFVCGFFGFWVYMS